MPDDMVAELRAIGARIETQLTAELYAPLQPKEPYAWLDVVRNLGYGPHERNVLDVFTSPDPGAVRDAFKFHCPAQALILLEQLMEFAVAKGAQGHGDGGQQQEREGREVTLLASLGRRWRWLLVVFFDALD